MLTSDSIKGNVTYDDWLQRCDNVMMTEIGLTTGEFPDKPWNDLYEEGKTPRQAVEGALHEEYFNEPDTEEEE